MSVAEYKKIIAGLIKFIESDNQNCNIPDHFFNDCDNIGFSYEMCTDIRNGSNVRAFSLIEDLKESDNVIHLKLVQ